MNYLLPKKSDLAGSYALPDKFIPLVAPVYAAIGEARMLGSYATFSGTLRATQFIDNSNNSYFLDPNATGTSLNVAAASSPTI